ncbi:MAG: ATP-binding cassette domain-containing protein, partial [Bacteroidetes bacterium]|nr:ATP-binding cassette domain-containing protein [Bacteroidota bacterium]
MLEAHQISKTYAVDQRVITVLDNISFHIEMGSFVVISGSSGSGKTTLLTLLSGLDQPTSGSVFIEGRNISQATEDELAPLRNKTIGFVF